MILAVGVEHLDFEEQANEGGVGGDERGVEGFATGRTRSDTDFDFDVLLVLFVEAFAGFADRDADRVVDVVDVANQPRGLPRDELVTHTRSTRRGVSWLVVLS